MDELNKQNTSPSGSFIGTGEGEVPLATPAQMPDLMRTAVSDLRSLQETGGQTVKPYIPETVSPAAFSPQEAPAKMPAENRNGGGNFQPPQIETQAPAAGAQPVPAGQHKKGLVGALVAFLIVVVVAAGGYFFIYPKFFANNNQPAAITENQPTVPANENVEPNPSPEFTVPAAEVPPTTTSTATSTPTAETPIHLSLLNDAATKQETIELSSLDVAAFKNALAKNVATTDPTLKEINLQDANKIPLTFSQLSGLLLPDVFTTATAGQFESNQYSLLVFSNSQGAWLSYLAKPKSGADLTDLKNKISAIEQTASLKSLFLKETGEATGAWKSGTINRYLSYPQNGNALNYGWINNQLLITTSYPAWQAINAKVQ